MTKTHRTPRHHPLSPKDETIDPLHGSMISNRPDPSDLLFEYSVGGRFDLNREKLLDFDTWDQSH